MLTGTAIEVPAVCNPSSGGGSDRRRDQCRGYRFTRRRLVGDGHLLAKPLQVLVDLEKLVAQRVAPRHKARLTQTHGHVLQIHEHEKQQDDWVRPIAVQQRQSQCVDRQRDGHAQRDVHTAEQRAVTALGHRCRRVHVVCLHRLLVDRYRRTTLA